jgi:hypothetical protein
MDFADFKEMRCIALYITWMVWMPEFLTFREARQKAIAEDNHVGYRVLRNQSDERFKTYMSTTISLICDYIEFSSDQY